MRRSVFLAAFVIMFAQPVKVFAHAFGVGGIDQYIRILPKTDRIQVELDIHFAELPTAVMSAQIDTNADGKLSREELYHFLEKATPYYLGFLTLHVEGGGGKSAALPLAVPADGLEKTCKVSCPLGEKGQRTIRVIWLFEAKWPEWGDPAKAPLTVRFHTAYVPPQCSRRIVYAEPEPSLGVIESDVPDERQYPRPPDITQPIKDKSLIPVANSARLVIGPRNGEAASPISSASENAAPVAQPPARGNLLAAGEGWLKGKVYAFLRPPLSPYTWTLAILLAFFWGAMHAMTPGHGKTIAGAYLAGASASYGQALILGIATTLSHTAVVLVLAVVGYAMRGAMTYPLWLEGVGAACILLIGLNQIRVGLLGFLGAKHAHAHVGDEGHHDHAHGASHDHAHAHGGFWGHAHEPVGEEAEKSGNSLLGLIAVGVSGGMAPCPAAIILLLLSWQLRVPGLGLACLIAFSLGLAGTLVGVGLLAVWGKNLILSRFFQKGDGRPSPALGRWLPIVGGLILVCMGVLILTGM